MTTTHTASVPARAALAGNPSDVHGGAVVATTVPSLSATVRCTEADRFSIGGTDLTYSTIAELAERVDAEGCGRIQPLVPATLSVLHRHLDAMIRPHHVLVDSTIPRSVGLAGSSAIVVATIRSMVAAHRNDDWAQLLAAEPALVASLALAAERDVLGISAGLQDRVVQAFDSTMFMEFAPDHMRVVHGLAAGSYRRLAAVPQGLVVAWRPGAASESGQVHAAVDPAADTVRSAMQRSAAAARAAASAIDTGDVDALGAAMDATFDQRAAVMSLEPEHVAMIDAARTNGAAANYTGSGGAVVVLAPDGRAAAALESLGCTLVML